MGPAKRHVESNMSEVQKAKMQVADLKAQVDELQEVKVSQQKKIREQISESEQLKLTVRQQEKAMARLERRMAKLRDQIGSGQALMDDDEDDEEEEEDVQVAITGTGPFLAPTASPVFKATCATPSETSSRAASETIPAGSNVSAFLAALGTAEAKVPVIGEALSARVVSDGPEKHGNIPAESVSVIATDLNIPQPTNVAFAARFADYRTKPDLPPVSEQQLELEAQQADKKKKKGGLGRRTRKWIGFF
eukprot:scaffold314048_cov43-Prasinocladus_malaysianus.AAC.1